MHPRRTAAVPHEARVISWSFWGSTQRRCRLPKLSLPSPTPVKCSLVHIAEQHDKIDDIADFQVGSKPFDWRSDAILPFTTSSSHHPALIFDPTRFLSNYSPWQICCAIFKCGVRWLCAFDRRASLAVDANSSYVSPDTAGLCCRCSYISTASETVYPNVSHWRQLCMLVLANVG